MQISYCFNVESSSATFDLKAFNRKISSLPQLQQGCMDLTRVSMALTVAWENTVFRFRQALLPGSFTPSSVAET
jgi:hypothetical protein